MANNPKIMWAGRIASLIVCGLFAYSAVTKLNPSMIPDMAAQMERLGLPTELLTTIAYLELTCVILYLIPATSVLGAILFTGYIGGAILCHLRVGDPVYLHVFLGLVLWGGLYVREGRLHQLIPFRQIPRIRI
jgi:hypothetical protein